MRPALLLATLSALVGASGAARGVVGVTTTIFAPTTTVKQIASLPDWCLVIAGDRKSPREYNVSGAHVVEEVFELFDKHKTRRWWLTASGAPAPAPGALKLPCERRWGWVSEWAVDTSGAVLQPEGWESSADRRALFEAGAGATRRFQREHRFIRRRWYRVRRPVPASGVKPTVNAANARMLDAVVPFQPPGGARPGGVSSRAPTCTRSSCDPVWRRWCRRGRACTLRRQRRP